jgi:hypothetical protein
MKITLVAKRWQICVVVAVLAALMVVTWHVGETPLPPFVYRGYY